MKHNQGKAMLQKTQGYLNISFRQAKPLENRVGAGWCARFLVRMNDKWISISKDRKTYARVEFGSDPHSQTGMEKCARDSKHRF